MARYTIDGQILTDLGDVIRVAKFSENPKEVRTGYAAATGYNGETNGVYEKIYPFNDFITTYKITILDIEWIETSNNVAFPPRVMIESDIFQIDTELPWSATINVDSMNDFMAIHCLQGAANISYTVEPCDDNGEVIKSTYTPGEIVDEINDLPIIPKSAFKLTGDFGNRFISDYLNWFIENYGELVTTEQIISLSNAFYNSKKLTIIPFDLNISGCINFADCFRQCYDLTEAPRIKGTISGTNIDFSGLFESCASIRELPDDYFTSLEAKNGWTAVMNSSSGNRDKLFYGCYSLRKIPNLSVLTNFRTGSSYNLYCSTFYQCYCLDEVTNLPLNARLTGSSFSASANMFNSTFEKCFRLKNMTFETDPETGNPLPAHWNKQVITLTTAGWATSDSYILKDSVGFTADTKVTDDASYQALKNDPDWWTTDMAYSRYNRASAVATINSLPDTSERGGSNTITFKGAAGSKTDAGAISNLSEEEIAVAAAKGWTVTFA